MATLLTLNEKGQHLVEQLRDEAARARKARQDAANRGDRSGFDYWNGLVHEIARTEGWVARAFDIGVEHGFNEAQRRAEVAASLDARVAGR